MNITNSTIDSFSLQKHKLLKTLYEKGEINIKDGVFSSKEFSFQELESYMNGVDVHAITNSLTTSKDIEGTVKKSKITLIGAGSYLHKKYLKEYRKSIFEYAKNLLQVIIFITTILFLIIDRLISKPKIDRIEKSLIKLESENELLKQFIQPHLDKESHRNKYSDSTKRDSKK